MQAFDGISEKNLAKRIIVFDLEDILVSAKAENRPDKKKLVGLLEKLSALEKKISGFKLFLVSGYAAEQGWKRLKESGLEKFFKPENVFFVNKKHIDSMEEVDRQRYLKEIEGNGFFQDDYFKQTVLKKISDDASDKKQIVFICHDLLTDAYYSLRFSGVDLALVKKSLSLKHEKAKAIIKGLAYIQLDWGDFRKLLLGKKPSPNYFLLKRFIGNYLQRELVGGLQIDASGLAFKKNN